MLYNAVTNDNYNKCVEWLSNNVNNNPNAHDIILLVSEYVESNYLDTNQLTDMNGATKFILMTEVLTGFSNEEFTSFLSDSPVVQNLWKWLGGCPWLRKMLSSMKGIML